MNEVKHTFAVQPEEQSGLTEVPQMKGSAHLSDANNQWEKIQEIKENPQILLYVCLSLFNVN